MGGHCLGAGAEFIQSEPIGGRARADWAANFAGLSQIEPHGAAREAEDGAECLLLRRNCGETLGRKTSWPIGSACPLACARRARRAANGLMSHGWRHGRAVGERDCRRRRRWTGKLGESGRSLTMMAAELAARGEEKIGAPRGRQREEMPQPESEIHAAASNASQSARRSNKVS